MPLPSISFKLAVPLFLLVFAAALCVLNVLYHAPRTARGVEVDAREQLFQDLSRLQSSLEYLLGKGDIEGARREVAILAFNHAYSVAVLADDEDRVIAATQRAWLGRPVGEVIPDFDTREAAQAARERLARISVAADRDSLLAYAGIQLTSSSSELRSSRVGRLFLDYDLAPAKSKAAAHVFDQTLTSTVWIVGLAIALWIAFHFLLTRRSARLVRAAEAIAGGDLAARSGLRGDDELGRLSRAFDAMAAKTQGDISSYRALFDAAEDSIFIYSIETGTIVDANLKACTSYGYTVAEMRQVDIAAVSAGAKVYTRESVKRVIARAAAGERLHYEWHRKARDGSLRWDEVFVKRAPVGGQDRILFFTRDVTDKKRAAEELAQERERSYQREKIAALGSLLAGVAHELNNPLSVVVARAVLLEERGDKATHAAAIKIRTAAERCARIVRTFLAMARQHPPERAPVVINEIACDALELTAYALRSSGIEVERDLAEGIPAILADGDQLHQVVANLLINAQQALAECPPPRCVGVTSRYDAATDTVRLTIADNGPGIPAELRRRVFEPYFTTKPTGVGTGMGLSVSLSIIENHGGTLTVDCPIGGGTIFTVALPVTAVDPVQGSTSVARARTIARRSVLIVDDEPDIRDMLTEILDASSRRIATAASGREALTLLERDDFDVILTDMRMPDIDGRELYREIERRWPERAQRVVFVTGDTLTSTLREFADQCGRPVIEKPFLPQDVRQVVASAAAKA